MFKELLLDNSKIEDSINDYFNINYDEVSITDKIDDHDNYKKIRYNINFDDKSLFLDVFINSKGKTTLTVNQGKMQDEKKKLAEFIVDECTITDKEHANKSCLFENVDFEKFIGVIKLTEKEDSCENITKEVDTEEKVIYKLKGKYNDTVTVTYFKTKSNLRVQGLSLLLYNLFTSCIYEIIDTKDLVNQLDNNLKQNSGTGTVEGQYKCYLPNSYDKHTEKLKKSLLKSVYNLNVNSQEYTCTELVFEVLRALEGHIKITLYNDFNITSSSKYGTLNMFSYDDEANEVSIKPKYEGLMGNKAEYYKKAYKHIVIYRHAYFHWDFPNDFGIDETKQIDNIDEAKVLIRDTLSVIDEYYI